MVEPARIERVAEGGDGGIVAVEGSHSRSSTAASSLAVTPPADPARRRLRRKRSGSAFRQRREGPARDAARETPPPLPPIRSEPSASRTLSRSATASGGSSSSRVRSGRKPWLPISCSAAHRLHADPGGAALIGERAVEEAVAEHPGAALQRRADGPGDMVGAGGGEEQGLGLGSPAVVAAFEQQLADRLGAGASAGLAGLDHLEAAAAQRLGERPELGRLAGPLAALEADEAARHSQPNNDVRPFQIRPKKPASPTASAATRGMVWGGVSGGGDDEVGDMLALGDRRLDRAVIDDLDPDVGGRAGRQGHGDAARRDQRRPCRRRRAGPARRRPSRPA